MTGREATHVIAAEAIERARGDGPDRRVTCRCLRLSGNQRIGEAVDSLGEVRICQKHLARCMELIKREAAAVKLAWEIGGGR